MSDSLTDETTDVDKPETTANEKAILNTTETKPVEQSVKEHNVTEDEDTGNKEERISQDVGNVESVIENTDVKAAEDATTHDKTQDQVENVATVIAAKITEEETIPDSNKVEQITPQNTDKKEGVTGGHDDEEVKCQLIDNVECEKIVVKITTPDKGEHIDTAERVTENTVTNNVEDKTTHGDTTDAKTIPQNIDNVKVKVSAEENTPDSNTKEKITPHNLEDVTGNDNGKCEVESVILTKITEGETLDYSEVESATETDVKALEEANTLDNSKAENETCQKIDTIEIVAEKTEEEKTITEEVLPSSTTKKDVADSNKPEEDEQVTIKISQSSQNTQENAPKQQSPELDAPSIKSKDKTSAKTSESSSTAPSKDDHAEHVTYTEDGSAIYTDPQTKYQYKWCTKSNNWTPIEAQSTSSSSDPYENEHYKWCQATQKWIPKQTQAQVTETEHYKWDAEKQQWIPKVKVAAEQAQSTDIVYDIDEDGQRIYTDKDGTVFFWDVEKSAWFPKIDDDFMARYQMSYGFIDNTSAAENEKKKLELEAAVLKEKELQQMTEEAKSNDEASKAAGGAAKRKAPQEPPKWFEIDPERNTKVYVSNLPLDITLDEFTEVMGKCGMIMRDPQTQKFKLKLYTEADGQIKGDGLCDYIKVESVDLALKILDEYDLRGHKIRVQQAQFQMRGEYNPALKPKRKKKDKEKLAKIKEKLFDWRPEKMRGERSKHEKTVIIKNLFHPELFEKEVQLILDYQNDLREECSKCGTVRKVVVYDRHSEGVAQINMASPEEADLVIQMMQGRFFGKRQLTAEHWDGKTKYKIEETEEEIQKRLNKWDKYLETDAHKSEVKPLADQEKANVDDCEKDASSDVCEKSEAVDKAS